MSLRDTRGNMSHYDTHSNIEYNSSVYQPIHSSLTHTLYSLPYLRSFQHYQHINRRARRLLFKLGLWSSRKPRDGAHFHSPSNHSIVHVLPSLCARVNRTPTSPLADDSLKSPVSVTSYSRASTKLALFGMCTCITLIRLFTSAFHLIINLMQVCIYTLRLFLLAYSSLRVCVQAIMHAHHRQRHYSSCESVPSSVTLPLHAFTNTSPPQVICHEPSTTVTTASPMTRAPIYARVNKVRHSDYRRNQMKNQVTRLIKANELQKTVHYKSKQQNHSPTKNDPTRHSTHTPLMSIISANVNGLRSKIDQIRLRASANTPHIIACQETKISEKISSTSLSIENYKIFRKDRNENGGGVALFVRECLKPIEITGQISETLELVAVKWKIQQITYIVASVYRPPRRQIDEFIDDLTDFIGSLGEMSKRVILLGDLNICALLPEFNVVKAWGDSVDLRQVVCDATHGNRLIDHIYVPTHFEVHSCGIASPIEKTHAQTWIKLYLPMSSLHPQRTRSWKFSKTNWTEMNLRLMKLNLLSQVQNSDCPNTAATFLEESIRQVMVEIIPRSSCRIRKSPFWFTKSLVVLHRAKEKAYRKWRSSGQNDHRASYKRLVKKMKKEMFVEKKKAFFESFSECKNPAKFWSALNKFTGRSYRTQVPTLMTPSGTEASSDADKAEVLKSQFASVFIPGNYFVKHNEPEASQFIPVNVSVKMILKYLQKLPPRKAMGRDDIPAVVLRNCALVFAPCLASLAELIIRCGAFPEAWKMGIVIPVPKGKLTSHPADYRPITLLPIISKVIEKCISEMIQLHVNSCLSEYQFGFRQRRSTTDAILYLQHLVLRGFEKCEVDKRRAQVAVIYFDIAKAFDSVPHKLLLDYLSQTYSLPSSLLTLLQSYLTDRLMRIKVGSQLSEEVKVTSGVPQGSVLGPLLFTAYINAVAELQLSSGSQLILYADDMVLVHPLNSENAIVEIQDDINKINERICALQLQFNSKKCKFQIITLSRTKTDSSISFKIGNDQLEQVSTFRYLGVYVDENFTFAMQSQVIAAKTKLAVGELNRTVRKWAPRTVFMEAVTKLAFPLYLYAIEVWFPPIEKERQRLEKVVKFAARLSLNNFRSDVSYLELLEKLKWKSVSRMVAERRLITIRKYLDGTKYIPNGVFEVATSNNNRFSQRLKEQKNRESFLLATFSQKNALEDKLSAAQMRLLWNELKEDQVLLSFSKYKEQIISDQLYETLRDRGLIPPV
jgi:hypothetical protein